MKTLNDEEKKDRLEAEISKSGFILEYQVGEAFSNNGWTVVSNKYYIDDISRVPREIDLLVSKSTHIGEVEIVTNILISCKKSEERDWVFLSKLTKTKFETLEIFYHKRISNQKIKHIYDKQNIDYHVLTGLEQHGISKHFISLEYEITAFQEVLKKNQKLQNQTNIYRSIESLIKAQAYELGKLDEPKSSGPISYFYLLNVTDTNMYLGTFSEGGRLSFEEKESINYKNHYIVNGDEGEFNISFITPGRLDKSIQYYNKLHESKAQIVFKEVDAFYFKLLIDSNARSEFNKIINNDFQKVIEFYLDDKDLEYFHHVGAFMKYDPDTNAIIIQSEVFNDELIKQLKQSSSFRRRIRNWFKQNYKFEGKFNLEQIINLERYYDEDDTDYGFELN